MADEMWVSEPLRPVEAVSPPSFAVPPLACDSHMHVFCPPERYNSIAEPRYTRPEGAHLERYLQVASVLGLERMVLVQPSYYGTDNSCMLDALKGVSERARAVVFLPQPISDGLIDSLCARRVTGARLDLFKLQKAGASLQEIEERLQSTADLAREAGWHVELYVPGLIVSRLLDFLGRLDVDFSINHMGYMTREEGLNADHFRRFLELAQCRHFWVKLTGPYRIESDARSDRAGWMAQELIAAMPDRVIWGSDWPHIPGSGRDTGELLNRLSRWCPDAARRKAILVDNPARLYRFSQT